MLTRLAFLASLVLVPAAFSQAVLKHDGVRFQVQHNSSRYALDAVGDAHVHADDQAGILLDGDPVRLKKTGATASSLALRGSTVKGKRLRLLVLLSAHQAELRVTLDEPGAELRFQTKGASPGYGLADHAVYGAKFEHVITGEQFSTEISGFADDHFVSGQGIARLVSNFAIYPTRHFAEVLIDPTTKIVHSSPEQIVQGVKHSPKTASLFYFFGDPHEIYANYLHVRTTAGYKVVRPKYQAFGVGWEAFGALAWDTDAKTVTASVDRYLKEGYPLRWIVIGSGHWPARPESMHETTSFGLWDLDKYPHPGTMIDQFRKQGLTVMLGLRITFIVDGPFSDEGVRRGFFLQDGGKAKVFIGEWPKQPYYLLDAHNSEALDWYMSLAAKWRAFGIRGWKEDFYGYGNYDLRDDKVDPINDRLFALGDLIIERNGYLSSNGDLHRINDFNYNQNQDRGPVNALSLAYSGFPFVYPDIVGGTFGENHFKLDRTPRLETYMMRNAQWAALHSSMGMGEPPWSFQQKVSEVMLSSARLHERIAPYLYSNAQRAILDGYPWTMTPLPVAFPDDPNVHGRENSTVRGYEWLIGDSMLAVPLYGDDFASAQTRDVYLPEGQWMDFDTGTIYNGRQSLKNYALPVGKTPLFIGGPGVTLEAVDGETRVCIYLLGSAGTVQLQLPDGTGAITVHVPERRSLDRLQVRSNASVIATAPQRHALSFVPRAGAVYTVANFPTYCRPRRAHVRNGQSQGCNQARQWGGDIPFYRSNDVAGRAAIQHVQWWRRRTARLGSRVLVSP